MTQDLIARAKSGDADAFRRLTEPLRRELEAHCYRLLGSLHDAQDTLQEVLFAAWQGFAAFEGRASLRTWLYRIATNRCLNARRSIERRPAVAWNVPGVTPPEPTRLGEAVWLEPFPDEALEFSDTPLGPEARYDRSESIALAFVKGLQALPHRQLAVLILRDVVGFPAAEVAGLLETTVESVNSALKRARAGLKASLAHEGAQPAPAPDSATTEAFVAQFVKAYEASDLDALVAFLTDDVFIAMPPMPYEYIGRGPARAFLAPLFGKRRYRLLRTGANGQPAFGMYVETPDGWRVAGLLVLGLRGARVCALTRFERSVALRFGLPEMLSADDAAHS